MSITEAAGGRRTAKADAMEFLQAALAGDPVPATEVSRMAHERGLDSQSHTLGPRGSRSKDRAQRVRAGFQVAMVVAEGAHRCPPAFPQKRTITRKP